MRLIDGGVWANNPTMVGIAEAVSMNVRGGTKDHSNPSRISCVSAGALAKARSVQSENPSLRLRDQMSPRSRHHPSDSSLLTPQIPQGFQGAQPLG